MSAQPSVSTHLYLQTGRGEQNRCEVAQTRGWVSPRYCDRRAPQPPREGGRHCSSCSPRNGAPQQPTCQRIAGRKPPDTAGLATRCRQRLTDGRTGAVGSRVATPYRCLWAALWAAELSHQPGTNLHRTTPVPLPKDMVCWITGLAKRQKHGARPPS